MHARLPTSLGVTVACIALAACGSVRAQVPTPTVAGAAIPTPPATAASGPLLQRWPEFGLDPQRSAVSEASTGITAGSLGRLRRTRVSLPGTVDSAPVYLHGATVAGAAHDVAIVTTTYGRTVALDADRGHILWSFTPSGYGSWAGSSQITTASPLIDPSDRYVYAASPDGRIHKLSIAAGAEQPGWPVTITRNARREKVTPSLNIDGPYVIAATGGYFGDAPPYQGHVVLIDRASGRLAAVYNTLCANRPGLLAPSSCRSSDSAILSRAGAVVEPGGGRILISTGNGPWNGTTDLGDSVLELTVPGLRLRQAFTPLDQRHLQETDTDLGSGAPVLLGSDRLAVAGKDGIVRVLALSRLDGHAPSGGDRGRLGGELQQLATPGGGELFSSPAVWQHGGHTTVFFADEQGTAAYVLRGGRLLRAWQNSHPGTSPVLAGGLLYVYDQSSGGIYVYHPGSAQALAKLPGQPGHWNSPIVVDGKVIEPEGNGNDHSQSGTLEILSVR